MISIKELLHWIEKDKISYVWFDSEIPKLNPYESIDYIDMNVLVRYITPKKIMKAPHITRIYL